MGQKTQGIYSTKKSKPEVPTGHKYMSISSLNQKEGRGCRRKPPTHVNFFPSKKIEPKIFTLTQLLKTVFCGIASYEVPSVIVPSPQKYVTYTYSHAILVIHPPTVLQKLCLLGQNPKNLPLKNTAEVLHSPQSMSEEQNTSE